MQLENSSLTLMVIFTDLNSARCPGERRSTHPLTFILTLPSPRTMNNKHVVSQLSHCTNHPLKQPASVRQGLKASARDWMFPTPPSGLYL